MSKKLRYGMTTIALALSLGLVGAHATDAPNCLWQGANKPCDISFTAIPTFANMCLLGVQTGIYTIKNNTRISLNLNYIRIQNNDGMPNPAASVLIAPTNNCGTSLAAGASCNILFSLQPLALGQFNRVLQIGVNSRQIELDSPPVTPAVNCGAAIPPAIPAGTFPFTLPGPAFTFSILAGTTVTNTGATVIAGDVGVSPGSAITGFPPGVITNGTQHAADPTAATAQLQLTTAYNNLAGLPCGTDLTGQDLGGKTLAPGVYCFKTSAQLTGPLTLSGAGTYVFQIGSTLTTASNSAVLLANYATDANVFWQVGSSATLGTNTQFKGSILALTSITLNTGATLLGGRALARNGAVTLDTNAVNPAV